MKFLLAFSMLFISNVYGQTTTVSYDISKLKNICMFVGSRTEDPNPLSKRYTYMYQRRIFEAAGVDVNKDSEDEIARKVSGVWELYEDKAICNNLAFDVKDGSVLKYGVATKFDAFIYDIIKWKINLNKVDASDNRTLLDYIQFQIWRTEGTSIERKLQGYMKQLRAAGAKFRSEL